MIIVIGNQKGGVGKSTLCFMIANYFANQKGEEVSCIDFDPQLTLYKQWKTQVDIYDNEIPYEVHKCDLSDSKKIIDVLKSRDQIILIDVPGNLSDNNLISVYESADLIICPFIYDVKTMQSTYVFAKVIKEFIKNDGPMLFVPNKIQKNVKYENKEEHVDHLRTFGEITEEIFHKVSIQRQSLFDEMHISQVENTPILNFIYKYAINFK